MAKYKVATNKLTGRRHICVRDTNARKGKQKVYFNIVGFKSWSENSVQFRYDEIVVLNKEDLEISDFQKIKTSLVEELLDEYHQFERDRGNFVERTTTEYARSQHYVIHRN